MFDFGAEKMIAAERGNQLIAVEIKSFVGPSVVREYHGALGQFLNYRMALDPRTRREFSSWPSRGTPTTRFSLCPSPWNPSAFIAFT